MKTATNYYKTNAQTREKILRRFSMFDGVGLDLTGAQSYDEALQMAGLDYTAEKAPLFLGNGMEVPNHFAVTKSDNPECVLGVVGNQYHAVSNKDAFAVAEPCRKVRLSLMAIELQFISNSEQWVMVKHPIPFYLIHVMTEQYGATKLISKNGCKGILRKIIVNTF